MPLKKTKKNKERKIKKVVNADGRYIYGRQDQRRTGRYCCSSCRWRFGPGLIAPYCSSFSCIFCSWRWFCVFKGGQHVWWWDAKCHRSQWGWTISNGWCDMHEEIFSSSSCIASLVFLRCNGQLKACNTVWSWAGDNSSSWRYVLPSISGTSTEWLQCWWSSPAWELQYWWQYLSRGCWG